MQSKTNSCLGCGAKLQNENIEQLGYVKSLDQPFCMSCFKLMHYGTSTSHFNPDSLPVFNKDSLIVVVTSILYLNSIVNTEVKRLGDNYKVVYLINQIDLLPDATSKNYLLGKVQKSFRLNRVTYEDIVLMSAINPHDIEHLKSYLLNFKEKNIYLIGLQNSGKTTIFKALTGNKDALALPKAALTQSILKSDFNGKQIFDTPGLYQSGYLHEFFDYTEYKDFLPTKQFKPRNGTLKSGEAMIIGGLVAVSVIKGETKSTLYVADSCKHHLTKSDKVELLLKDGKLFNLIFDHYSFKDYKLQDSIKYQFTLADFGILHIMGPVTIRIYSNPKMHLTLNEGFFK
ncbi:GTPase [Acholeplasma granularum]|uniref:GTPase n=1 Tax=Acholeplasma granularum TaxID=264635 RepID=UPI0004B70700|nr:GTPase [Acholeplasma granularum]